MEIIKIFLLLYSLFNFANCRIEVNEVKNAFSPSSGLGHICSNGKGEIIFHGYWKNTEPIPSKLEFELTFDDGNKYECILQNEDIKCPKEKGKIKIKSKFSKQFMDANQEYLLNEKTESNEFNCSSLYIYSNFLLLFIIIFILFN